MRPRRLARHLRGWFVVLCLSTLLLSLAAVQLTAREQQAAPLPHYLLRDDGGQLCLYSADGASELRRYDVLTRLLPEGDVEALLRGIPVYSDAELLRLVEDFGG